MFNKLLGARDFFVQLVHYSVVTIDGKRASGHWIMYEVVKAWGRGITTTSPCTRTSSERLRGSGILHNMFLDSTPLWKCVPTSNKLVSPCKAPEVYGLLVIVPSWV